VADELRTLDIFSEKIVGAIFLVLSGKTGKISPKLRIITVDVIEEIK